MRTLAIECTTEACSVALFDGDAPVAGDFRMLGRGHAEALVPMIAALPEKGRASRIIVGLGPGSFTGVRIGLAAARALGLAWGAEVLGYPTLALVALGAREQDGAGAVQVAMTGGHGEWFCQSFGSDGLPASALASLAPDAASRLPDAFVAGSQAQALVDRRGSGQALVIWPDARLVRGLPAALLTTDLSPLYGRAPDARLPGGNAAA
ncbi:MAG: tRNA (adenosine(37)-N6)-threonylcarbamoyltransferase complex dimerization subunit type 1 TsaB [Sphingomonadales bacterium]|nr:tRNA (adenosine(37)-N6)-threonylcarbamoyltransferase complex dimerization subunit type 1 TsaB [Sphingomonadales bacterium]